jgi:hypothetical protein
MVRAVQSAQGSAHLGGNRAEGGIEACHSWTTRCRAAPDFPTARALLAPFDLARFNLTAAWQPATKDVVPVCAPWREDLAGRSLLHAPQGSARVGGGR